MQKLVKTCISLGINGFLHRTTNGQLPSSVFRRQGYGAVVTAFNYQHQYKPDEIQRILHVINGSDAEQLLRYDLSKGRGEKIKIWQSKNGAFTNLEQVLELDGFGVKVLDKFCNSILRNLSNDIVPKKEKSVRHSVSSVTKPPFYEHRRSNLKSCLSIHTGINSVSWSRLELIENDAIKLDQWNHYDIGEAKLHLNDLIQHVTYVNYILPHADIYVMESPQVAQGGGPQGTPAQININIQKSQLIAMVSMALASRRLNVDFYKQFELDESNKSGHLMSARLGTPMLFMRQHLASRLFRTFVGNERVSNADVITNLLRFQYNVEDQFDGAKQSSKRNSEQDFPLVIEANPRQIYGDAQGFQKEYMGNSLLLGLAFLRLCVIKDENSLAALNAMRTK